MFSRVQILRSKVHHHEPHRSIKVPWSREVDNNHHLSHIIVRGREGVHAEKCSRFNLMMDFVHSEGCLKHALLDQLVLVLIISIVLKIVISI